MSSCKDMDRLIQLYVDQEIEEADRKRLGEHVAECNICRNDLQEMINLVESLEEIRKYRTPSKSVALANQLIKWAAVCTSIAFLVAFFPGMTQHRSVPISKMANGADPGEDVVAKTHHLTVLATQAEKLHIPESDYVQVIRPKNAIKGAQLETALVYPSALPFILDGKPDWFKEVKRFVFVRVPDDKTMGMILAASGLTPEKKDWEKNRFPLSVILVTGKNPRMETFTFPDNKQKISRWFDRMAATPVVP